MSRKTTKKLREPNSIEDFYVDSMRKKDPNYMSDDPRFNKEAMEKRSRRAWSDIKNKMEHNLSL